MLINETTALADLKWLVDNMERLGSPDQLLSRQELAAILREATEQKTAGGWISVEDRLPEGGFAGNLIYDTEGQIEICKGYCTFTGPDGSKEYFPDTQFVFNLLHNEVKETKTPDLADYTHITHWMPCPEPPKEDKAHG